MPYAGTQLLQPLVEFLPALQLAVERMTSPHKLQRPGSFRCLLDWVGGDDALFALTAPPSQWEPLPCEEQTP